MRCLERVFDDAYEAFDGVKVRRTQRATGKTRFMRELERRFGPYP